MADCQDPLDINPRLLKKLSLLSTDKFVAPEATSSISHGKLLSVAEYLVK